MAPSTSRTGSGSDSEPERQPSAPPLASTLVAYADRPDRRTVYPPGTTSVARMSTWLTADADAFCGLEGMR